MAKDKSFPGINVREDPGRASCLPLSPQCQGIAVEIRAMTAQINHCICPLSFPASMLPEEKLSELKLGFC